jgi:hypothetical protein
MAPKRLLLVLALVFSRAALGQEVSSEISSWDRTHPAAAATLASLIRDNPEGARRLFLWNRDHPLRAQAFVAWINGHPDQSLDDFLVSHRYWPVVDLVLKPYRPTVEAFIAWGRAHPDAAQDLASQPRGLAWVGFHVFGDLWDSQKPGVPTDAPEQAIPQPLPER